MSSLVDKPIRRSSRAGQHGFSLLEALISVLVLGVGLLGVAALQINALKNNQSSLQRTQAVTMVYYMFDAMRANRSDAVKGLYNLSKTCTVPAASSTLVANDLHFWVQTLKDTLGDDSATCGQIDCAAGAAVCKVIVYWNDQRGTGGLSTQTLEVATRL